MYWNPFRPQKQLITAWPFHLSKTCGFTPKLSNKWVNFSCSRHFFGYRLSTCAKSRLVNESVELHNNIQQCSGSMTIRHHSCVPK